MSIRWHRLADLTGSGRAQGHGPAPAGFGTAGWGHALPFGTAEAAGGCLHCVGRSRSCSLGRGGGLVPSGRPGAGGTESSSSAAAVIPRAGLAWGDISSLPGEPRGAVTEDPGLALNYAAPSRPPPPGPCPLRGRGQPGGHLAEPCSPPRPLYWDAGGWQSPTGLPPTDGGALGTPCAGWVVSALLLWGACGAGGEGSGISFGDAAPLVWD